MAKRIEVIEEWLELLGGTPNLVCKCKLGPPQADRHLTVHMPLAAVEYRKWMYQLQTDDEAIEAILKEHASREFVLEDDLHPHPVIAKAGGLRPDVRVERKIHEKGLRERYQELLSK